MTAKPAVTDRWINHGPRRVHLIRTSEQIPHASAPAEIPMIQPGWL